MKMKRALLCSVMSLLPMSLLLANAPAADYDVVIRGGRVLDGAGNPWVRGDVAIKDGRVVQVGQVSGHGAKEIDAKGRYVSPGFIDMMDQSGGVLLKNGAAENKLRMGVTTVIAGEGGTPVEAAQIPSYFAQLEKQGISVNFGSYYSTTQARMKVMGDGAGNPTPTQMDVMRKEVRTAMEAGAFGVTSALIYPPSSFSTTADLIAMAKVSAQCGGFYATHMRDESGDLVKAVNEAIEIGETSGAKVEIFHLKAAFAPGWGKLMPEAIAAVNAARARGVDVAADLYPYTAGGTGLEIIAPSWVWADGVQKGIERLKDPKLRERMKKDVAAGSMPGWSNLVQASGGFGNVILANGFSQKYAPYHGQSLEKIGAALKRDPADVAWDILLEGLPNRSVALYFMMTEGDIETALHQPWVSIGSDAAASETFGQMDALGLPHPRAYGTFPRIIAEYVKRRPVLSLEDAVRKMTGWPAQRMGLTDRGLIRDGMRADIVIFDLDRLDDVASWDKPTAAPTGIDTVLVNGVVTIEDGRHSGAKAGAVLRHGCGG
ncbi:N-acyl-D-amino-acid deacylase family protein [Sphingobium sp. Leaf26]|uniref:N-acyl-D-amino-acid deacylase family protein n=1 Tax=Sphingobium sp. Leaf26 TaxID=1735693 RepID=UPI001F213634|nr:amidohydrolase family protein [Sphingobium sp. Leaf26]